MPDSTPDAWGDAFLDVRPDMREIAFTIAFAGAIIGLAPSEAQAEQATCLANQAVYARADGSEFIVRHIGVLGSDTHGTRYIEGAINGEKVVFATTERSSSLEVAGSFSDIDNSEYAHRARYWIKWTESPVEAPDQALISKQGPAWAGTWKIVRCDGKSVRAAAAIQAAKPLNCPIDQVTFIDENTGRRFKAERYAEDFVYLHEGGESRTPPKDKNGKLSWSKMVGYWILQGTVEGSEAYLFYEQIDGSPCCSFNSYYPGASELGELKLRWLKGKAVPILNEENKDVFAPEEVDIRMGSTSRNGPLTGMTLVPVECDAKSMRSGK